MATDDNVEDLADVKAKAKALAARRDDEAYERGATDALRDNTIRQHTEHLALINGSIERAAETQHQMLLRLGRIEEARERETAVNQALSEYLDKARAEDAERAKLGVTSKQLLISVIAIVVPVIVSIIIAIIVSSSHP